MAEAAEDLELAVITILPSVMAVPAPQVLQERPVKVTAAVMLVNLLAQRLYFLVVAAEAAVLAVTGIPAVQGAGELELR